MRAVRSGWLPFFPQFDESSLELAKRAKRGRCEYEGGGHRLGQKMSSYHADSSSQSSAPDALRTGRGSGFIWRGNALMSSAKGHEYFLHHYLVRTRTMSARTYAEEAVKDGSSGSIRRRPERWISSST